VTPADAILAARVLHDARREGRTIDAIPEAFRPRTVDEGYAVQDALVALALQEAAEGVVGWKLGATTPYWQRRAGLAEPMAGRLLASTVHHGSATLRGQDFHLRMVECEYAFRLGRDLPAREAPYTREEVEDATAAVHGCIEVADSRYAKGLIVDSPSLIADNVLAGAYLVGPEVAEWRSDALTHAPVKVWVEGKVINEGKGEHTGGHPILPLVWLANDRRKRGDGLKAGMLVSTSSSTGAYRAPPQAVVKADYGPAGTVTLTLV
jgi:2-keto-4-pentenoate hydratase